MNHWYQGSQSWLLFSWRENLHVKSAGIHLEVSEFTEDVQCLLMPIKICEEVNWEPLRLRRWFCRLTVFYMTMHRLTPPILLWGGTISATLSVMRCTTCVYEIWGSKRSFHPDAVIISWNDLRHVLRQTEKLSTSKAILLWMIVSPEKGVLNTHSEDLRFSYQLRMRLSTLKANKFRHEFTDTLSNICIYGSRAESTMHFFLCCLPFDAHRER